MKYTIKQFRADFATEDACLDFLLKARMGGRKGKCPSCKNTANWSRIVGRKTYACSWCGKHVSPTAGAIFHKSETKLTDWFHAIFMLSTSKNGVSAKLIERQVGVTYKTAFRMMHKIRSLMAQEPTMFGGTVEIDETYIGGKRRGKRGRGAAGKTAVFGISERGGGVFAKAVPNVQAKTVMPLIRENVKIGTRVMTDELASYQKTKEHGYSHETIKHAAKEYARGDVTTNGIEGFWSQLKRSIDGTHHSVSPKHLQKYLDEHVFRWNRRNDVFSLFSVLLGRV